MATVDSAEIIDDIDDEEDEVAALVEQLKLGDFSESEDSSLADTGAKQPVEEPEQPPTPPRRSPRKKGKKERLQKSNPYFTHKFHNFP